MDKHNGFNLKKLLSALACFLLIVAMTFSVACSDADDSSSSSSSSSVETTVTATDYQTLKNGDFEFGTAKKKDTDYPVYSGVNWTRSNDSLASSAPSSSKNSGIINTQDDAYKAIAEKNDFPKNGDGSYFNPKTPEALGLVDASDLYVYDEETAEDNPNADGLLTSGSKILMIHNVQAGDSNKGKGTAQKFTSSSSLTTTTGYAKLSVWVLTKDLKTVQNTNDYGAYIAINNTLSSSRSPLIVKNINTNGKWVQYTFYIEASDYASSSFKVVLGLGFGGKNYGREFVEGYAYFDNVHFEEIEKADFDGATVENNVSIFNADGTDSDAQDLILSQTGKNTDAVDGDAHAIALSHRIANTALTVASSEVKKNDVWSDGDLTHGDGATAGVGLYSAVSNGIANPLTDDNQTVYINLPNKSSYSVTTDKFELAKGEFRHISFKAYVDLIGKTGTGAKIEIEEVDANGNLIGKATAIGSNIDTYSSSDNETQWKDVSVFVRNDVDSADSKRYFRLRFTLGTTDRVDLFEKLTQGIALFTGFSEKSLTEKEFGIVSSSADYKATFSLGNEYVNGVEGDDTSSDSYTFNPTSAYKPSFGSEISKAIVGYTGVVGGHTMVGGSNVEYYQANTVAGLVNTENDYQGIDMTALRKLSKQGENEFAQPIVINNSAANGEGQYNSYGFLGSALTLSANTTTQISVKVKAYGDAKAYVYLVNAEALSNFDVLSVKVNGKDAQELVAEVTASSLPATETEWVDVNFVITTGNQAITYRVELWNGKRDGSEASVGLVAFDQFATSTAVDLNTLKAKLATFGGEVIEESYTRANTTVTSLDEDGNEVETIVTYKPEVNYTKYVLGNTVIASYANIDAPTEIDNTNAGSTDDSTSSDSSSDEVADPTGNIWALQLVSIIIAVVLVAVLVFVLVRMIVKKNKKAAEAATTYYSRDSREINQERIRANKAKRAEAEKRKAEALASAETAVPEVETADDVEETPAEEEVAPEYDYDNPENNLDEPKDDTTGE